jgi:hypothetical protein
LRMVRYFERRSRREMMDGFAFNLELKLIPNGLAF